MADAYTISPIPSIGFSFAPVPVISVTVDKTGPAGSGVLDDIARSNIAGHTGDSSDPHGQTLTQTALVANKATVAIIDGGAISTSQVINFANGGCYKCTATGTIDLTVSSLGAGQRGSVHILPGATLPVITWTGVGVWLGGVPTYVLTKLTVVTLFNDGTRIVGAFAVQA